MSANDIRKLMEQLDALDAQPLEEKNMSYVMFENTAGDLQQCISAMEEADTMGDLDLNSYEASAIVRLDYLCSRFQKEYARLQSAQGEEDF